MNRKSDTITEYVSDISKNIEEFKSTQPASGKSFVNYSVSSSNIYDFALTTTVFAKAFRITFIHELADKYNIVDLSFFVRIDDPNVMANPYLSNAPPYTTEVCFEAPQLGKTTWILDCTNLNYPVSHTFYFKFYFNGTTTGTFSAAAI